MKPLVSQVTQQILPNVAYRGFDDMWRLVSLVRLSDRDGFQNISRRAFASTLYIRKVKFSVIRHVVSYLLWTFANQSV